MKRKLLVGMTVCGVSLLGMTATALAASTDANTDGSIEFKTGGPTGPIIKPEIPEKEIEPEGGGHTEGDLRISFVPDFKFGVQELAVGEQHFSAGLQKYIFTHPTTGESGDKYMPQFVQVFDGRGKKQGWHLNVSASVFTTTDGDTLPGARITLGEAKLSNDIYDFTEITQRVSTFGDTGSLEIPTGATNAKMVMATKTNDETSTTDGSNTSVVFDNDYIKDKLDYPADGKNTKVTLKKTSKDIPLIASAGQPKKVYKSTITWTLSDGL